MELKKAIANRTTGPLCRRCRRISLAVLQYRLLLHSSFHELLQSSSSCRMCELVSQRLRYVIKQSIRRGDTRATYDVTLVPHGIPGKFQVCALGVGMGELWLYAHPDPMTSTPLRSATVLLDAEHTTLPLLARALEDCIQGRGQCYTPGKTTAATQIQSAPLLPKRILEVSASSDGETPSIRLREPEPGERSLYVTLSHRWGKAISSKTTLVNIGHYKQAINFNSLPRTFQDAVVTSRRMGFKYLWVDALCIIQDDLEDWKSQAPLMGQIFQNAVCNIAAHSASDSSCGFLSASQGGGIVEISPSRLNQSDGTEKLFLGLPRSFDEVVLSSRIIQRGWIQQELILSHRLMHFSRGLLYWECPHTTKPRALGFIAELHAYTAWGVNRTKHSLNDLQNSWISFVEHYSTCELTFESDRLIAIDGLARVWMDRLESETVPQYHYGHFINPASLLWAATSEVASKRRDVPSWSWASIGGKVQFMKHQVVGPKHQNLLYRALNAFENEHHTIDAKILSVDECSVRGTCELVVQAQTRTLELSRGSKAPFTSWWNIWAEGGSPMGYELQEVYGSVFFDEYPAEKNTRSWGPKGKRPVVQVHCARISTFEFFTQDAGDAFEGFGVLLLQPGDGGQSFRRVGVGLISKSDWFRGPAETLHIQ